MKINRILHIGLLLLLFMPEVRAQDEDDSEKNSNSLKGGTYGYKSFVTYDMPDSVKLNVPASGTHFLYYNKDFELTSSLKFRISGGFSFSKLKFNQFNEKTFPSDSIRIYEKLRKVTFDIPVGFIIVFSKDERGEPKASLEAGGYANYMLGSSYKIKQETQNEKVKAKFTGVGGIMPLQYGIYGKLHIGRLGLIASYRLSDFFDPEARYQNTAPFNLPRETDTGKQYPFISQLQVGIFLEWND